MKRYFKYIALICLSVSALSCKKGFLEESSQDLVRPTTTVALNQLMTGEAYPLNSVITEFSDLLTDDIQSEYNANATVVSALNKYAPAFTWQKNMIDRLLENSATNSNIWYNYYARIKGCNVVLDYVDQVDGTESEKQNLRGQALALRSFYYLMLVNYFGKPYYGANGNPEIDLGVPLILTADVTDNPVGRSTVKAVYAQIENDLLAAIPLLDAAGAGNHIYKFNGTSARFLLSRVYLYMGNWDASIRYADATLQKKSTLKQMNEITTATFGISSAVSSPEVIWGYGFNAELSVMPFGGGQSVSKAAYFISDDLGNTFPTTDLRAKYSFTSVAYITTTLNTYKGRSAKFVAGNTNGKAFRTAEVYLNRAEAYIQKAIAGDGSALNKALTDINLLRSNRITSAAYTPISITNAQDLYAFYKAERRRELCLEDSRWFDLRRWGMPELKHTIQLSAGTPQVETLQQNDNRYTLAIPTEALTRNPNLIQNP
ncbi:RagB/SusD family nutrient uptake outer membrane protein [Pedobacter paludis]|nr:RagB/SusD family nutrient uptake outer membrane protein [Pedobacter paludis]